eukprot:gene8441-17406_t
MADFAETSKSVIACTLCTETFDSKNQLFKHLITHGYISSKLEKIVLLVGWKADNRNVVNNWKKEYNTNHSWTEEADNVEYAIWSAIHAVENGNKYGDAIIERPKGYSRGSSCAQRACFLLSKEESCHGICDVLCMPSKPCLDKESWIESVNNILPQSVRVMDRITVPKGAGDFHAESVCSQRRWEYMVPLDILLPLDTSISSNDNNNTVKNDETVLLRDRNFQCEMDKAFPRDTAEGKARIECFRKLKIILKSFAGKKNMHNFETGGASPDDAAVRRKVDRIYHMELTQNTADGKIWVIFSISGDAFLRGQARHMMGLAIAVSRSWLPMSYLEAALSDDVVLVPPAPESALWLAEDKFDKWEAKHGVRLGPQWQGIGSGGGTGGGGSGLDSSLTSDPGTERALAWRKEVIYHASGLTHMLWSDWEVNTSQKCTQLLQNWTALQNLRSRVFTTENIVVNQFHNLNIAEDTSTAAAVSQMYLEVLRLLREADHSGNWPTSSFGRQKVIEEETLVEGGVGGRGGSFSVGYLPPPLTAPRGNELFPELVRACFKLESVLLPSRTPSSTIAINRHAQFRPHRDSGAGSGQSRSLITALGDFQGGELVVEGVPVDIRYRHLEFDGWGQRHWTLPFSGERYSLVWFTPLGAEDSNIRVLPRFKSQIIRNSTADADLVRSLYWRAGVIGWLVNCDFQRASGEKSKVGSSFKELPLVNFPRNIINSIFVEMLLAIRTNLNLLITDDSITAYFGPKPLDLSVFWWVAPLLL